MSDASSSAPRTAFANRHQEMMPKIDIELGSTVQIKFNPIGGKSQYTFPAAYIGVMHYKFLALHMSFVSGLQTHLLPGTLVEIQYQLNGAVHSFRTEILAHTMKPVFIVFVSYPDRMSVMAMRAHRRLFCALPCSLQCEDGHGDGIITDISAGGCRVIVPISGNLSIKQIEKDTDVMLSTIFSTSEELVSATATVRSVDQEGAHISFGVVFKESDTFLASLKAFLQLVSELPVR